MSASLPDVQYGCMRISPVSAYPVLAVSLRRARILSFRVLHRTRQLMVRLREFAEIQTELHERMLLLEQPWREELVHWSYDGHQWRLHGDTVPSACEHLTSLTRSGWCPMHDQHRRVS